MTDFNPIDLLKEEMENDDTIVRINAMHRLKTIVTLINDNTFKSQIVPYLQGLLKKEEDEVLLAIGEELGKVSSLLPASCISMLPILESLCSVQEPVVTDASVHSLLTIANMMKDSELQDVFIPMVMRLSEGFDFWQKVSAINMMTPVYLRAGLNKDKIKLKFIELSREETPQIRRAIASKIGEFASVLNKETVLADIIPVLRELALNDRDPVRVLCLEGLATVIKLLTKDENKIHILPLIFAASEDDSWKIRHALSKNLPFIAEALGKEICEGFLAQIFTTLLKDSENEVKVEAVFSLSKCLTRLPVDKLSAFLPQIQALARDKNPSVKIGIVEVLANFSRIIGKEMTMQKLFPTLIELTEDINYDVKISALQAFVDFSKVIDTDIISPLLANSQMLLAEINWRVRAAVYETLLGITIHFKRADLFTTTIQPMFLGCLKDRVQTIREFGINSIRTLTQIFPSEGMFSSLAPTILELLSKDNNYLIRITGLHCLKAVSEKLSAEVVISRVLPTLISSAKDPVPNVRVVVVKILKGLAAQKNLTMSSQIKPVLEELRNDEDKDVQYFVFEALLSF